MTLSTTYPLDDRNLLSQLSEAAHYQPFILRAAEKYSLQPAIIAGLCSRESNWGLTLKPKGPEGTGGFHERKCPTKYRTGPLPADGGFGRGLLQIDFDAHEFARGDRWKDPQENILYGCKVLAQCLGIIRRKAAAGLGDVAADLSAQEILRAALASYNAGPGRVLKAIKEGKGIDHYTPGRDYSADVFNRARWFQAHGWA